MGPNLRNALLRIYQIQLFSARKTLDLQLPLPRGGLRAALFLIYQLYRVPGSGEFTALAFIVLSDPARNIIRDAGVQFTVFTRYDIYGPGGCHCLSVSLRSALYSVLC